MRGHSDLNRLQDCIPVGCVVPACWQYLPACTVLGDACSWGGAWSGGVCSQGVPGLVGVCLWSQGVPASGPGGLPLVLGVCVSQHAVGQTLL